MLTLKELREKLAAKRAELIEVFKETQYDDDGEKRYDFRKASADWLGKEVLKLEGEKKSARVVELVNQRTSELNDLQDEYNSRETAEKTAADLELRDSKAVGRVSFPGEPGTKDGKPIIERKSFGEQVVEHSVFQEWLKGDVSGKIFLKDVGMLELKTLFQTSAGWAPESTRIGVMVPAVTRPLQVTDIIPSGNTGQANVIYMEETTRTHAAVEKAEGAAYPESEFVLTEQTSPVRKIADSIPVTDEQLEDVAMVQSYLEGRLNFGVQQRLDGQIVAGDGIAPNLRGILNVGGILTQAKGADPVPDAIFKAGTKIRVTGRAEPTHVLLHPNDWEPIRLLRTADGIYIWGSPSEQGPARIWGWPIVQNDSLTAGVGLMGSFLPPWITAFERRGIIVERGMVDAQFTEGKQTIRASGRYALVVYRPAAFATITGI